MLAIAIAAGAGIVISRRMTRPLATLSTSVERLAEGDSTAPVLTERASEIRALARAFTTLRDRLVARTAERDEALREARATEAMLRRFVEQARWPWRCSTASYASWSRAAAGSATTAWKDGS